MPAIDLARLKTQSAKLVDKFHNHYEFIEELINILQYYTNRTMRNSHIVKRLSIPTHHTPTPVLKQIERDLVPLADRFPSKALTLATELWKIGSLETRLLSANLIGMIAPIDAIPLLARLPDWLAQTTDKLVFQTLLVGSFSRIRRENPDAFFLILEEWLKSTRPNMQRWGMQALIPLISDSGFQNLPAVFRILQPAILSANLSTQSELQTCLKAIEQVSPKETILYLRELIFSNPSIKIIKIFNRMLPAFPPTFRTELGDILNQCRAHEDESN